MKRNGHNLNIEEHKLSDILIEFISLDRAYFISKIGKSKSIYDRIIELGKQDDFSTLLMYIEEFWFMDEVRTKFLNYYSELSCSHAA
mgnify:CR=1 FL=1